MARYVDGFVLPAPKKSVEVYRQMASKAGKVWRDHRARAEAGETVVFSWIVFKSRAHRDRVNAKVMKDPRIAKMMGPKDMTFDVKRMVYGDSRRSWTPETV